MAEPETAPFRFARVAGVTAGLVLIADILFFGAFNGIGPGSTLGVFALAWTIALPLALPAALSRRGARVALIAALGYSILLVWDPGLIGWLLLGIALYSAALLTRARFDDALSWFQRLFLQGLFGFGRAITDPLDVDREPDPDRRSGLAALARLLALPLLGGAMFLMLFAGANPLIGDALANIHLIDAQSLITHLVICGFVFMMVWPSLRADARAADMDVGAASLGFIPEVQAASVILSLIVFNALFAVQNLLDVTFLWSGAPLPDSVTLAGYAHRGAYLLILTALLAGGFVLALLRPGSASARSGTARALVALWVLQNQLLVASSMLRTIDYVEAYSLTVLRIWALGWMALVGIGLALICWRLLRNKSAAWLINANALAAAAMLTAGIALDPAAVAARWNVDHASRDSQPNGPLVDVCYLNHLSASALLPLIDLERSQGVTVSIDNVRAVRKTVMDRLTRAQSDWHSWTWRGAVRLAEAQALLGPTPPVAEPARYGRACDGSKHAPPASDTDSRSSEPEPYAREAEPDPAPPPASASTPPPALTPPSR